MNWTATNEQRQSALLRIFYMLVFMALLIIRAGLESRGASACLTPGVVTPPDLAAMGRSGPSSLPPSHLYIDALRLLRAAEAVLRRLDGMTCEIYELLKQAYVLAELSPALKIAGQSEQKRDYFDTS